MTHHFAFAVVLGSVLASTGAFAACAVPPAAANVPPTAAKQHAKKTPAPANGCVNLNGLPQISEQIVANERQRAPAKSAPPSLDKPYTGPTLGLTKPDPGVRPTPTVGYHWTLD